jgi:hypothetical protein
MIRMAKKKEGKEKIWKKACNTILKISTEDINTII